MYLAMCSRIDLLPFLPKSGVVVEIGVARGGFSKKILQHNAPKHLHLIDPWEYQDRADYSSDPNNCDADEQEKRYGDVCALFDRHVQTGQVTIHRKYSDDAADTFADRSLDWVFIDGLHTYEGVKADLEHYHTKVKEDGFIVGHDYANHPGAVQMGFGTIQAVREFVRTHDYHFLLMTYENFPTYVLCKKEFTSLTNPKTGQLIGGLLAGAGARLVSLPDYPGTMGFTQDVLTLNGDQIVIPTFTANDVDM